MFVVENRTSFKAEAVILPDRNGILSVVTVIKVTCSYSLDGVVSISEDQVPLCFSDKYFGDPRSSGIRFGSDLVYEKKGADIAVNGTAYAPKGRPVRRIPVTVAVGDMKKTVVVMGDRTWTSSFGHVVRSRPEAFVAMPLRYERAYGGQDTGCDGDGGGCCRGNPVGTGFSNTRDRYSMIGRPLPNIERPDDLIRHWKDRPEPTGFGLIPPTWEPRQSRGGTYDEMWRRDRMPMPPIDADILYGNAAAPDLVTGRPLSGDEDVTLIHLHPGRETVRFSLPGYSPRTTYDFKDLTMKPKPLLDTLVIEPDESRFILVYRSHCSSFMSWSQLRQVTIHEEKIHSVS